MQKLLEQLIICVNYAGLLDSDIQEIVKVTREFFVNKGFNVNEGIHKNISVHLNDPKNFEEVVSSNTDVLKKYVFNRKYVDINLTKSSLDICVMASGQYEGAKTYQEYISYIYNEMVERFKGIIAVSRIGIRKINSLFIRNINEIEKYFVNDIFNCCATKSVISSDDGIINMSGSNITIKYDNFKVNLNTEIQMREAKEILDGNTKSFNVYRIVLDIDAYRDKEVGKLEEKIEDILEFLSNTVTNIYNACLTKEFRTKLNSETADDDKNIFGGIK